MMIDHNYTLCMTKREGVMKKLSRTFAGAKQDKKDKVQIVTAETLGKRKHQNIASQKTSESPALPLWSVAS